MKNVIIHIGYPKAASTWLKKNLFPLASQYHFVDEQDVIEQMIKPNALTFNPEEKREFFENKYGDNIIISESMLSGSLVMTGNNSVYTKEISNRLKLVFPEAQIVLFIRNQLDIISSSYLEYIKKGGSYNINKYLWRTINIPLEFRLEFFEFDKIITQYYSLFREEKVYVFCYEQFVENPTVFTVQLNEQLMLNIPMEEVNFGIKNNAYQKNLYPVVRFLNQFTRKGVFLKRYFIDIPCPRNFSIKLFHILNKQKIFGGKADPQKVLGSRNLATIQQYFKKSNQNLAGILDSINLEELGYPI